MIKLIPGGIKKNYMKFYKPKNLMI